MRRRGSWPRLPVSGISDPRFFLCYGAKQKDAFYSVKEEVRRLNGQPLIPVRDTGIKGGRAGAV